MKRRTFVVYSLMAAAAFMALPAQSKNNGGLDAATLNELSASFENSPSDKAIRNALANNAIDKVAANADNKANFDNNFSHKVKSKGITNQKSSGRCWLFTGLNVLRSQIMDKNNIPELELSQNYNYFYDQLEKSNLFLQSIIDTADLPFDDKKVEWLFQHPLADGGQFTGFADNITKYGIVPKSAMPESFQSSNTSKMRTLLMTKLREDGLQLRKMKAEGASAKQLEATKTDMLKPIYRMLSLTLGNPPSEFTYVRKNKKGEVVSRKTYTPQQFYKEFAGNDLKNGYVMLMNDPTREYYKLYEIDLDRHVYDGDNWKYINLPMDEIKKIAIESIKDSTMMYYSCDVGKFIDRENGTLDINNYDYESLMGTTFGMNKADRIRTNASASSHAMTLMAVDLDENGQPVKWMVENSWGPGANEGHLIMTDEWFDEYTFRLVAKKKYADKKILDILKQKPVILPCWDPMY